ncbi:hypothetical protein VPH35_121905 [Triticum aestivum]
MRRRGLACRSGCSPGHPSPSTTCTTRSWRAPDRHILPDVDGDEANTASAAADGSNKSKAILIASLQGEYYERIKSTYYENAAEGGGRVGVFQPSHEERQTMGQRSHNQKALAEIYLLSFSDVLLTTGISTFGYMSSSLAGLRPAMLMIAKDHKVPETPCVRAVSMEPCFHMTPDVRCQGKAVNKEELSRHVKECEDVPKGMKWIKGIKLVD